MLDILIIWHSVSEYFCRINDKTRSDMTQLIGDLDRCHITAIKIDETHPPSFKSVSHRGYIHLLVITVFAAIGVGVNVRTNIFRKAVFNPPRSVSP